MAEQEKNDFYSAKDANKDWNKKLEEKNAYVNPEKIKKITDAVKDQIAEMEITSESWSIGYKFYDYHGYLSPGEVKTLQKLGFKVKFEEEYDSMHGDFHRISW